MPSVRGSCTTCTSCSQKSHVYHSHTVHICAVCAACAARAALICTTASCISLSPSVTRAARACSFSVSRCSCSCVLLRLSWRRTVEVGVEFQCIQLSHWVDVCFILWRCRTHRIFMWETQTYCGLVGSGGADTHTDPLSHFSFFPSCLLFLHLLSFSFICLLEPTIYCLFTFFTYMFNTFATTIWLFVATLFN